MNKFRPAIIFFAAVVICGETTWGQDEREPKYRAPVDILVTLPKICWWFYMDNIPNTAEYNIRITCGINSNHYCPGLVKMKLAENAKTKQDRSEALIQARNEMEYTLRMVKADANPECAILPLAKSNLDYINIRLQLIKETTWKR